GAQAPRPPVGRRGRSGAATAAPGRRRRGAGTAAARRPVERLRLRREQRRARVEGRVNAREEALDVAALLPHGAGLRLVDRVVSEEDDRIVVDVTVRGDGVFGDGPTVPAWIALEYMAQAMAAWSGIQARRLGRPVRVGLL